MKIIVTNPDGSEPELQKIYREESWAVWDFEAKPQFAVMQGNVLILICPARLFSPPNNYYIVQCPEGRFTVRVEGETI